MTPYIRMYVLVRMCVHIYERVRMNLCTMQQCTEREREAGRALIRT